jgi:hypothetical protein
MKHIRRYSEIFESSNSITPIQENFLMRGTKGRGRWYFNKETGLIDVEGDFSTPNNSMTNLYGLNFGRVTGKFDIFNTKIYSLKGSPLEVGGDFDASSCFLSSLDGSPVKVGGDFEVSVNKIKSLDGCPEEIGGSLWLSMNSIKSLKGLTKKIGYSLQLSVNPLESLEGCPEKIDGNFNCSDTLIRNLIGGPKMVGGDYRCNTNPNLDSLEGAPLVVGGNFYLDSDHPFKWTGEGKGKEIARNPKSARLLIPTIQFSDLVILVKNNPTILSFMEYDKNLRDRVMKELGWDKMGPELLRNISSGIFQS